MEATHRFREVRPSVAEALSSQSAEVRSAAVAVFNEANDIEAHDLVFTLARDRDVHVQEEVLEYLEQFPRESDALFLLEKLVAREHLFLASSALSRLCGGEGPLITEEEANGLSEQVLAWEKVLRAKGLVA